MDSEYPNHTRPNNNLTVGDSTFKDFDPNGWLQQLAVDIESEAEYLQTTEDEEIHCISIECLQGVLAKYFPIIKLISNE